MKRLAAITIALVLALPASALAASDTAAMRTGKFQFFGTAEKAKDPTNVKPTNHVIRMDTTEVGDFGSARRFLFVKVDELDDQLSLNFFFESMTCFGGSPRYQLAVDTNGDGTSNGNAFGYIGPPPNFTPCPMGSWEFQDLQDGVARWDLSQFGGPMRTDWNGLKAFFAGFPDHEVLRGALVQDAFAPQMMGVAYYDNVQIGDRTYTGPKDGIG